MEYFRFAGAKETCPSSLIYILAKITENQLIQLNFGTQPKSVAFIILRVWLSYSYFYLSAVPLY